MKAVKPTEGISPTVRYRSTLSSDPPQQNLTRAGPSDRPESCRELRPNRVEARPPCAGGGVRVRWRARYWQRGAEGSAAESGRELRRSRATTSTLGATSGGPASATYNRNGPVPPGAVSDRGVESR